VIGGISVVVIVGTLDVDDDFWGFGGFGGPGIASFALHYALAVEQKLRDVGERGGVAPSDAAMDQLVQQVFQEMVYVGRYGQTFHAL
jgi:hypothetical protein